MDNPTRERASDLFSALANQLRLHMVEVLQEEPKTVGEIAALLGISQPGASQNLAILARAGVLRVERKGTCRYYRVRGPRIGRILELIEEFCHAHALYGVSGEDTDA